MKNVFALSVLFILCATAPTEAQIVRRPLLQRVFGAPIVQGFFSQPLNIPIGQFFPNSPIGNIVLTPRDGAGGAPSQIVVDAVVVTNLKATEENLNSANDILQKLRKANNLQTKGDDSGIKTKD